MKSLFLIPARGGSKGILNKNVKDLCGKPLIQYTIDEVRKIASSDDICVSTDSVLIKQVVESLGLQIPFLRPDEIATDYATSEEVIGHALTYYKNKGIEYEFVVLLQPTSPFRNFKHINECISLVEDDVDMVVSVKLTNVNPYYVLFEENKLGYLEKSKTGNFSRRQDCPDVYELNGAIYVIRVDSFLKRGMKGLKNVVKYVMNKWDSVDIDDLFDWYLCELIIKMQSSKEE